MPYLGPKFCGRQMKVHGPGDFSIVMVLETDLPDKVEKDFLLLFSTPNGISSLKFCSWVANLVVVRFVEYVCLNK